MFGQQTVPRTPARVLTAVGLLALLAAACSGGGSAGATTTVDGTSSSTAAATSTTEADELTPMPRDRWPFQCAEETARALADFEAALEAGPTLAELCAVVGPPDWTDASGLLIYDLDDGGQVRLGFGGLELPVTYAQWEGPGGESRSLLSG